MATRGGRRREELKLCTKTNNRYARGRAVERGKEGKEKTERKREGGRGKRHAPAGGVGAWWLVGKG